MPSGLRSKPGALDPKFRYQHVGTSAAKGGLKKRVSASEKEADPVSGVQSRYLKGWFGIAVTPVCLWLAMPGSDFASKSKGLASTAGIFPNVE